jgi:hypothetical protein
MCSLDFYRFQEGPTHIAKEASEGIIIRRGVCETCAVRRGSLCRNIAGRLIELEKRDRRRGTEGMKRFFIILIVVGSVTSGMPSSWCQQEMSSVEAFRLVSEGGVPSDWNHRLIPKHGFG